MSQKPEVPTSSTSPTSATGPTSPSPAFDPFSADPKLFSSARWLWATAGQAVGTTGLLLLQYYFTGHHREAQIRWIVIIGIVATWSLALRTIRQRLVELMVFWRKASQGLLRKASESGRHLIKMPLQPEQEKYIKGSIWRLRIIAAGLTIPFFVMPVVCSYLSAFQSLHTGPMNKEFWAGLALFLMVAALIVAGYFHWAILPGTTPVRVSGSQRRYPSRRR